MARQQAEQLDASCAAQKLGDTPRMDAATIFGIFGKFLYLFLASLVMGVLLGLLSALLLKRFNVSGAPQVHTAPDQAPVTLRIIIPY